MRCYICNNIMEADEIKIGVSGEFEPCSKCIASTRDLNTDPDFVSSEDIGEYES